MHQVLESKPCDESEIMNKSITFYVNFAVRCARIEELCVILQSLSIKSEIMEIWNEFCSYLIDCKERDVSEERYHEIIEIGCPI